MESSSKNLVEGLEHLASICKDGIKGYESAAENAKEADLKSLFLRYSDERKNYLSELQVLIRDLGGNPDQSQGFAGSFHRAWTDIKESLNGHDRHSLLASCEQGEDAALEAYRNFFADEYEYTSKGGTRSLYTITGGTNHNYESTGMDSGNGLNTGSEGYSNTTLGSRKSESDYSSTSDPSNIGANTSRNADSTESDLQFSGNTASADRFNTTSSSQTNEESPEVSNVYPVVKKQLDGVEKAHNQIKFMRDHQSVEH